MRHLAEAIRGDMIYRFGEFELDTRLYELRRGAVPCRLEPQVFDVLRILLEHHARVVTKEELIDAIWPERFISEAALNTRLMAARKAIGDSGREQRLIKTVHGRGYRFVGEVEVVEEQPAVAVATPGAAPEGAPPGPAPRAVSTDTREPEIRFCTSADGTRIAYATVGDGPPLVKAANWMSHLEFDWRSPIWRHWIEELSRDHMLVRYDERGCGLSDWDVEDVSFSKWIEDMEAVVDALGLERFPILGISQGCALAITYAVRHPERVSQLIIYGGYTRGWGKRGGPEDIEEREALLTLTRIGWGRDNPAYRQVFASGFVPDATFEQTRWFNDICRASASPENAVRLQQTTREIDVSDLLSQVRVPTLVLHARGDQKVPFDEGRRIAAGIRGARFVPLDGNNHILLEQEPAWPVFLSEVRAFLGVTRGRTADAGVDTVQTILFTDIEGSTSLTQRLGDETARRLFREYEDVVRRSLAQHGGTEIKALGDGFMVSFRSPARAVECAVAIQRGVLQQGDLSELVRVRIGINAGEPIPEAGDLHGTSVNMAARIADEADGGEIVVSDVVRQLIAGKGFLFADRGPVALRGFDDPVRLHSVRWE